MDPKLLLGLAASVLSIICFLPYLVDIFRKRTQPHAYSWLIWTILQGIGVATGLQDGAGYGILGIAIGAFFCFTIFLLSLFYGTKNITRFDTLCLIAAICALLFYILQRDPLLSVIIITLIDFLSFLPTMRKTWEEPTTETPSTYALSALAVFLGILALQNYTVTTVLYLASLVVTNSALVLIVLLRKKT